MVSQGLFGALEQFWTVEPKARLDRRNSYFEDNFKVDNESALKVGIVVSTVATAIVIFWSLLGVVL